MLMQRVPFADGTLDCFPSSICWIPRATDPVSWCNGTRPVAGSNGFAVPFGVFTQVTIFIGKHRYPDGLLLRTSGWDLKET